MYTYCVYNIWRFKLGDCTCYLSDNRFYHNEKEMIVKYMFRLTSLKKKK